MKKKFRFLLALLYCFALIFSPVRAADPATLSDLNSVFGSVLRVALAGVGIAVTIMFVIGGYQFMMAGSDKDAAARARHTLTYAVIGLVLALSAWIILTLVGTFLGVNFANFDICWGANCIP